MLYRLLLLLVTSMDPNIPYSDQAPKLFGIGPPPPDIVNPLDRLARRPRLPAHITPPFAMPFPTPQLSAAQDTMSLNFAPPPRSKINSHNTSTSPLSDKHMKESSEAGLMKEQGELTRLVYFVHYATRTFKNSFVFLVAVFYYHQTIIQNFYNTKCSILCNSTV